MSHGVRQGFETVIELVPPNVVLPPTVFTVKRTDPTFFRIPDFETVHCPLEPVVHDALPLAPLLQDPETATPAAGEPLFVTAIVTFAVHLEPLLTLVLVSATFVPLVEEETVTLREELPVEPSSSVTVSVTVYVPGLLYVCDGVAVAPFVVVPAPPKLQA